MAVSVSNNGRQALPLLVRPRSALWRRRSVTLSEDKSTSTAAFHVTGNQKGRGPTVYRAVGHPNFVLNDDGQLNDGKQTTTVPGPNLLYN